MEPDAQGEPSSCSGMGPAAGTLVLLTGGTGGAKLVLGLHEETAPEDLTVVCNTADDSVVHGLHVSPDVDTIVYPLAGLAPDRPRRCARCATGPGSSTSAECWRAPSFAAASNCGGK